MPGTEALSESIRWKNSKRENICRWSFYRVKWVIYFLTRLNLQAWRWSQTTYRHISAHTSRREYHIPRPALILLLADFYRMTYSPHSSHALKFSEPQETICWLLWICYFIRFPVNQKLNMSSIAQQTPTLLQHTRGRRTIVSLLIYVHKGMVVIYTRTDRPTCVFPVSLFRKKKFLKQSLSRDSSVGITTLHGLDGRSSIPRRGKRFFSSS
jgi:hypothetical protein